MKKVLIISITLALVFLMAGVVAADEVSTKAATISELRGYGETVVSYGVSEGYSLQIPSDFKFTAGAHTMISKVSASSVSLYAGHMLNVTVSSHHGWKLVEHEAGSSEHGEMIEVQGGDELAYKLSFTLNGVDKEYKENSVSNRVPVLQVLEGAYEGSTELTFTLLQTTSPSAGHFQDKLYFNSEIVLAPTSTEESEEESQG